MQPGCARQGAQRPNRDVNRIWVKREDKPREQLEMIQAPKELQRRVINAPIPWVGPPLPEDLKQYEEGGVSVTQARQ